VQSIPLQIIGPQPPATSVPDRPLKWVMQWPMLHLDAMVNGYDNLYSLREPSKAVNREPYRLAVVPGVIIPSSLIVMTKVMMFALYVCMYSMNPWVHLKRSPCLFKRMLRSQLHC